MSVSFDDIDIETRNIYSYNYNNDAYTYVINRESSIHIRFNKIYTRGIRLILDGIHPSIYVHNMLDENKQLEYNKRIDIDDCTFSSIKFIFTGVYSKSEFILKIEDINNISHIDIIAIFDNIKKGIDLCASMIKKNYITNITRPLKLDINKINENKLIEHPDENLDNEEQWTDATDSDSQDDYDDDSIVNFIKTEFKRIREDSIARESNSDTLFSEKPVSIITKSISDTHLNSTTNRSNNIPTKNVKINVSKPKQTPSDIIKAMCLSRPSEKVGWNIHHSAKLLGFDTKNKILELGNNSYNILSLLKKSGFNSLYGVYLDKTGFIGYKYNNVSPNVLSTGPLLKTVSKMKTVFDIIYIIDVAKPTYNVRSIIGWLKTNCKFFITITPNKLKSHTHNVVKSMGFSQHSSYPAQYFKGYTVFIFKNKYIC